MAIRIKAMVLEDKWVYVERDGSFYLLRPPLDYENPIPSTEGHIAKAVAFYGFTPADDNVGSKSFDSFEDVISFVTKLYVDLKKSQGAKPPTKKDLRKILKYATDAELRMCLKRVREKLIPHGSFDGAEAIVQDILMLDKIINNPELYKMAQDIQGDISRKRAAYPVFPDLNKKLPKALAYKDSIQNSRYMLRPAA
ncbi:MAG: hypothetical protein HQL06_15340 [Nitrospirae bacterium]|nr:hypothetical protein [Nitrospirota bacterium]